MDAQHQKTNKSAQFACYLREHTSSSSITSYIYLFALLFPPLYPFVPLPIQRIQAGLPGKQASKQQERAKVFGDDFFSLLFFGHGDKRLRHQELPTLPRYKPATANRRTANCDLETKTTMCDYTKVEYACYHLRYTVRAWCKSTYFSGHPSFFFFLFPFFSSFCPYISMSTARLTLSIRVFLGVKYQETHKVPTYLTLTFFLSFLSFAIFLGIIAGYLGSYVVSKSKMDADLLFYFLFSGVRQMW